MDLSSLLSPAEWADFRQAVPRREVVVRPTTAAAARFAPLWEEWELTAICRFTLAPGMEEFRMLSRGKTVSASTYTDRAGAFREEAFRQVRAAGGSLALATYENFSNPVLALSRHLEAEFQCPVQVNLYVTPGQQQGLGAHVDPHDVLVLQVYGEKSWDVYETSEAGSAFKEVVLSQGGWLFLPKGTRHEVRNRAAETSVHLTVGFHPLTWGEVFQRALNRARVATLVMNEVLPFGTAVTASAEAMQARLATVLSFVDVADHAEKYYAHFAALARAVPAGHLPSRRALEEMNAATRLGWTEEATLPPARGAGIDISLPYRRVPLSLRMELGETLRFMREAGTFSIAQLGLPDPASAILLCRFLAQVGVLRILREGEVD